MLYNLRIGKTRYAGKTMVECCDIIAARRDTINENNRMAADNILLELHSLNGIYRRIVYFGNNGKVFVSINKKRG